MLPRRIRLPLQPPRHPTCRVPIPPRHRRRAPASALQDLDLTGSKGISVNAGEKMYQRAGVKLHHGWMPNAPTGGLLVRPGANTGVCTRARDGGMARLEVLTGPERRRRWSV